MVHNVNPAYVPMTPRFCWFFNGFLLSLGTCRCSSMVLGPFCFSTRFLLSHGSLYEPCFRPVARHSSWFFNGFLLFLGTCCCSPMVHGSFSIKNGYFALSLLIGPSWCSWTLLLSRSFLILLASFYFTGSLEASHAKLLAIHFVVPQPPSPFSFLFHLVIFCPPSFLHLAVCFFLLLILL